MANIGGYLDSLVATASSPDRQIHARITNQLDFEVTFDWGAFDKYDEGELGYQLSRLGVATYAALHRQRSEAYRLSRGFSHEELVDAERPSTDPRQRRYEEQLNAIEGEGVSTGGSVRIRTVGMTRWDVEVRARTVQSGEAAFLGELRSAVRNLLADRQAKIIVLKSDHFDLGIPRRWREIMDELRATNRRLG